MSAGAEGSSIILLYHAGLHQTRNQQQSTSNDAMLWWQGTVVCSNPACPEFLL